MAKKRIKSGVCPNCDQLLSEADNYCPNCGQENDDKRQSFGRLIAELVEGFMSIESKVVKSLPALLFRPGFLSKEFVAGRRQRYLHPVRLFLTLVVLYFIFASSKTTDSLNVKSSEGNSGVRITTTPENVVTEIDSIPAAIGLDSIPISTKAEQTESDDDVRYGKVKELAKAGVTRTEDVLDSLQLNKTLWNRFLYHQLIRTATTDFDDFKEYLVSKFPWIVFSLIPVFALLLKLLFFSKTRLYIDHLVFAFHLHSFYFLIGLIYLFIVWISNHDPAQWLTLLMIAYSTIALKKFYMQGWSKTILKSSILLFLYIILAMISSLVALLVLFIIY
jgi:hypothetical protein